MSKYIVRFDDITPSMHWDNFLFVKKVLENYNIYSVLGVVPDNRDEKLVIRLSMSDKDFFAKIKKYKKYGDTIAQHGTYHQYINKSSGLLNINNKSEFSGLCYEEQFQKLKVGKEILEGYGIWQPYFMAPSHSFDLATLKALKALDFKAITDGYGFYPYRVEGITLIPQLVSKPIPFLPFGVQTICLHTNSMSQENMNNFIRFIHQNHSNFISFEELVDKRVSSGIFQRSTYGIAKIVLQNLRSIRRA